MWVYFGSSFLHPIRTTTILARHGEATSKEGKAHSGKTAGGGSNGSGYKIPEATSLFDKLPPCGLNNKFAER